MPGKRTKPEPVTIEGQVVSQNSPSEPQPTSNALALIPKTDGLVMSRPPEVVLEEAGKAAKALQRVIESDPDKLVMNGKTYLKYEHWQTVGRFWGYSCKEDGDPEPVMLGDAAGFKASAVILDRDGVIRSRATAYCMNDEDKWSTRPKYAYVYVLKGGGTSVEDPGRDQLIWEEKTIKGKKKRVPKKERRLIGNEKVPMFQLASMAQTRAGSKAFRNLLSWVAVMAGFQSTPAEEMDGIASQANAENQSQESGYGEDTHGGDVEHRFVGKVVKIAKGKKGALFAITVEHEEGKDTLAIDKAKADRLKSECTGTFDTIQRQGDGGKFYWLVVGISNVKMPAETPREGLKQDLKAAKPGDENRGHGKENAQKSKPQAYPTPEFKEVQRVIVEGTGDKQKEKPVTWIQVKGVISTISPVQKTTGGAQYVMIILHGLPDHNVLENRQKSRHNGFILWHKSLFPVTKEAKPNEAITLEYEEYIPKSGANVGIVSQTVEDIVSVGDRNYENGQFVAPRAGEELFPETQESDGFHKDMRKE